MERLEAKKIGSQTYYYYSHWAWVNGKCRRVWQRYLGKLRDIVTAVEGGGPAPAYAEVFQWGLPTALWNECLRAEVIAETERLCPKREQGLSTGEYLAIAAMNRAIRPTSKRSMWEWFTQTALLRYVAQASKAGLSSQRFWDHMERIDEEIEAGLWRDILRGVVEREGIDLSSICYDGTNFYTFIDTFNMRCGVAKRGKNKQGRGNLRQVSYALFCCADGHLPLFYDVYEGNRNDVRQFPVMVEKFQRFLEEIGGGKCPRDATTLVFDKGNNSELNFRLLDAMGLEYVGSVRLDEHKDVAKRSNRDTAFVPCASPGLEGTKAFRVKKEAYGRERVFVVCYNQELFNSQWLTVQHDIAQAMEGLGTMRQKLEDRANGVIGRGRKPTKESVERACGEILRRQHMKEVVRTEIREGAGGMLQLEYGVDAEAVERLADTVLGKSILITSREEWEDERIIEAYRSQYVIEDVFKEMKDRMRGSWWPMYCWTDSKIRVHGLYCTIAHLLRSVLYRRVKAAGLRLSLKRVLEELDGIREVVNVYPQKRGQRRERRQENDGSPC